MSTTRPTQAAANVNPVASASASASASAPKATNSSKPPTRETTLAPLLRHFVGINVLIETKNGRSFRGKIVEADAYMNVVLDNRHLSITQSETRGKRIRSDGIFGGGYRDAIGTNDNTTCDYVATRGNDNGDIHAGEGGEEEGREDGGYDWIHVRGSTIRYVIFGANVDVSGVIRAGRDRERSAGDRYRRGIRKGPG